MQNVKQRSTPLTALLSLSKPKTKMNKKETSCKPKIMSKSAFVKPCLTRDQISFVLMFFLRSVFLRR